MAAYRSLLLAGVAIFAASQAHAQSRPQPPAENPTGEAPASDQAEAPQEGAQESEVEEVVVNADVTRPRVSIDSISYSLADDLQATTGSLADALRNIPSVEVDPEGGVSLRGDSSVTILIDGRPSALLSGPGRGAAILQTSADQFSRIEVMTNPSAAYRPDGSGGVINLITRPNVPRPGASHSGSVRANVGTEGRYNLGVSGAWSRDRLTLTGDAGLRHDQRDFTSERVRDRTDLLSGDRFLSRQASEADNPSDGNSVRLVAEYRLDDQTQLTGELSRHAFESSGVGISSFEEELVGGGLVSAYDRQGMSGFSGAFGGATARLLRQFGEDHDWTTELSFNQRAFDSNREGATIQILPAGPGFYEVIDNQNDQDSWNFSSVYNRPMGEDRKLRLGYEVEWTSADLDNQVRRGPTAASVVIDPTSTNLFLADQAVHALYGTYDRPFGPLRAQLGLRLEYVTLDLNQVTQSITTNNDYFRVYPTLHLEYSLGETQSLRASYSRRVQRPDPGSLNPFRVYVDSENFVAGNPDLLPQVTDSYEVSWLSRANQRFYQATLYVRDTTDAFTDVAVDLGGGVLLTQPDNLGSSQSAGLELVANGRLHATLRYNVSLNVFHQRLDASNLGFGSDVEGTTVSGRATLNWQPTANDFVQLGGFWSGDSLFAQGRREGRSSVNFGYRRRLNERLSLQLTVRDVFDQGRSVTYYETPTFSDRSETRFGGRSGFLGFTWTFGNNPNRPQQPAFDFSSGPEGG